MNDQAKHQIEVLKKKIARIESLINSTKKTIEKFENEFVRVDYTQIDGISGWYDGKVMQGDDKKEYKVPENYAAKSKLVYGDKLKLIDEGGKKLFKQIDPVERIKVDGILTKKEGEWYMLCDRGSYKVSDVAAEYQGAALNSEVTAFLPKDNLNAPFATIDTVRGFGKNTKPEKPKETKKTSKPKSKPKPKTKPKTTKSTKKTKTTKSKPAPKKKEEVKPAEKIDLADDDLV